MSLNYLNIIKILPIIKLERYRNECSFFITTNMLTKVLMVFKNHFKYQFKILSSISGIDFPSNFYRFQIVYELLSIKYNARIKVKVLINELVFVNSAVSIYINATWWECEIWDMFGIFFLNQKNLSRLLTDYGFQGYPLRKDFPLSGFTETRYNSLKGRVLYEKIELAQEFRSFEFLSPWENYNIR